MDSIEGISNLTVPFQLNFSIQYRITTFSTDTIPFFIVLFWYKEKGVVKSKYCIYFSIHLHPYKIPIVSFFFSNRNIHIVAIYCCCLLNHWYIVLILFIISYFILCVCLPYFIFCYLSFFIIFYYLFKIQ